MKPDHPDMLSLRSRIQELDRQVFRERSQVASGRTNTMLADYRAALSAERALQGRVAQLKGSVLDLRGRSIQYNILQREVDTNRALYDALLQRYKEIGVAGGIGTTPVSIVDRAEVPGRPDKPACCSPARRPRDRLFGESSPGRAEILTTPSRRARTYATSSASPATEQSPSAAVRARLSRTSPIRRRRWPRLIRRCWRRCGSAPRPVRREPCW